VRRGPEAPPPHSPPAGGLCTEPASPSECAALPHRLGCQYWPPSPPLGRPANHECGPPGPRGASRSGARALALTGRPRRPGRAGRVGHGVSLPVPREVLAGTRPVRAWPWPKGPRQADGARDHADAAKPQPNPPTTTEEKRAEKKGGGKGGEQETTKSKNHHQNNGAQPPAPPHGQHRSRPPGHRAPPARGKTPGRTLAGGKRDPASRSRKGGHRSYLLRHMKNEGLYKL